MQVDARNFPRDLVGDGLFNAVVSKAGLDSMLSLDDGLGVAAVREVHH